MVNRIRRWRKYVMRGTDSDTDVIEKCWTAYKRLSNSTYIHIEESL